MGLTPWAALGGQAPPRGGASQGSVRRGVGRQAHWKEGQPDKGGPCSSRSTSQTQEGVPPPPRPSPGTPGVGGSKVQGKKQTAAPAASGHAQAELLSLGVAEAVQLHALEPPLEGEKTV